MPAPSVVIGSRPALHTPTLLCPHPHSPAATAAVRLRPHIHTHTQLKEVQNTLELVQGQRNELRQEVKDLKAALADAKDTLEVGGMPAPERQPLSGTAGLWPAAVLKAQQRMLSQPVRLRCCGAAASAHLLCKRCLRLRACC
jgi:hypothetical protein